MSRFVFSHHGDRHSDTRPAPRLALDAKFTLHLSDNRQADWLCRRNYLERRSRSQGIQGVIIRETKTPTALAKARGPPDKNHCCHTAVDPPAMYPATDEEQLR